MENDVIEEIVKESENWKENYVKLLIKICKDNGVGIEKLKNFTHKSDTLFDTLNYLKRLKY